MWFFLIWLLGYIAAYFAWRAALRTDDDYTVRARVRNLFGSLLSWASFGILLVLLIIFCGIMFVEWVTEEYDWDELANW